jgi:DNA primase
VAYIGRWPGIPPEGKEKYKFPEGFKKSLEIFNVHRTIKESLTEPLIVVQSAFDCMKIWQTGFRRVVAIMGNVISEEQSALLLQAVSPQGRIVLMFNEDEPAQSGCQNALMRLSPACYVRTIKLSQKELQPEYLSQKKFAELLK